MTKVIRVVNGKLYILNSSQYMKIFEQERVVRKQMLKSWLRSSMRLAGHRCLYVEVKAETGGG